MSGRSALCDVGFPAWLLRSRKGGHRLQPPSGGARQNFTSKSCSSSSGISAGSYFIDSTMMPTLKITEIKAFVPSKDFELSKQFYKDLGFMMASEGGGIICKRVACSQSTGSESRRWKTSRGVCGTSASSIRRVFNGALGRIPTKSELNPVLPITTIPSFQRTDSVAAQFQL